MKKIEIKYSLWPLNSRFRGTATSGVGLPVHIDEVSSSSINNIVKQSKHLQNVGGYQIFYFYSTLMTHPSSNVGVYPVLVFLVLVTNKSRQNCHKCCEVEEGSCCSEPKLLKKKSLNWQLAISNIFLYLPPSTNWSEAYWEAQQDRGSRD